MPLTFTIKHYWCHTYIYNNTLFVIHIYSQYNNHWYWIVSQVGMRQVITYHRLKNWTWTMWLMAESCSLDSMHQWPWRMLLHVSLLKVWWSLEEKLPKRQYHGKCTCGRVMVTHGLTCVQWSIQDRGIPCVPIILKYG